MVLSFGRCKRELRLEPETLVSDSMMMSIEGVSALHRPHGAVHVVAVAALDFDLDRGVIDAEVM